MSLVVTWFNPDFIALCSDGLRKVLRQDATFVTDATDVSKVYVLIPGRIVLAATGDCSLAEAVNQFCLEFIGTHAGEDSIFEQLESWIPVVMKQWVNGRPVANDEDILGRGTVVLAGWDDVAECMRICAWESLDVSTCHVIQGQECTGDALAQGCETKLANEKLEQIPFDADQVAVVNGLVSVVSQVADANPDVGGAITPYLLLRPKDNS